MSSENTPLIFHVIHHLVIGGMENGLVNLLNHLPESSFRHVVICIEDYSDFRNRITRKDVEVIALSRSIIGTWGLRMQLFRLCRTFKPAIVHSRNLSGLDAIYPARLAGVRLCVHGEHGRDVDDLYGKNWKLNLLRVLHKPLISRYITVSKDLKKYLVERVGVNLARITQIYNGVDTIRFSPAEVKPDGILPEKFIGKDKIVIGTVGRLQKVKDQVTLIKAFADFSNKFPDLASNVYLAIVGGGPLLEYIRDMGESMGISERLWLPGSTGNVSDVLKSLDLFVLPSLSEGISNTILEAMATGLPIIATDVGGNPELVIDGITGSLVPAGDFVAMADKFHDYINNQEKMRQHGLNGRQRVLQEFSLDTMVERYKAVYDSLLEQE